jgi:hypothetical protein
VSDESTVQPVPEGSAPVPSKPGAKGFFSTTLGKVVIIGGAIGVLAAIVGVVLVIVLGSALFNAVDQATIVTTPGAVPATATPPAEAALVAPVPAIENRDVFTPRNPFEPVILPASAFPTSSTASAGSTGTADTLVLQEIITDNGVRKAVLSFGGTLYTVAAGERLGNTPWDVLSVGTTTVTMRYAEEAVPPLSVGQGVVAK